MNVDSSAGLGLGAYPPSPGSTGAGRRGGRRRGSGGGGGANGGGGGGANGLGGMGAQSQNGVGLAPNGFASPQRGRNGGGGGVGGTRGGTPSAAAVNGDDCAKARAELDKAAAQAVMSSDEVTLALLLTSWANSLAEAQQHGGPASQFETVFHESRALETVTESIMLMDILPDSAVQRALVSLFGFVLYGDEAMHRKFAEETRALDKALTGGKESTDRCRVAICKVLSVLRGISADVHAYNGVLPMVTSTNSDMTSTSASSPRSPNRPLTASGGPAGPDPSKIVERSMYGWRRASARLHGEIALVAILQQALSAVDNQFVVKEDAGYVEGASAMQSYYSAMSDIVKGRLAADINERIEALNSRWWPEVVHVAAEEVFAAVDERSRLWLSQFETLRGELESQLDDVGIGFGPAARVGASKVPALVTASAGVAALVSSHQRALLWAQDTVKLLSSMARAFRALASMSGAAYCPPRPLTATFAKGLKGAFASIDGATDWSFTALHDKVLGSLQKSASTGTATSPPPQRIRALRFEEPAKSSSPTGSNDGEGSLSQRRRKPRHARMKSSPDELLHLNANFDDMSDPDTDVPDRDADRDADSHADSAVVPSESEALSTSGPGREGTVLIGSAHAVNPNGNTGTNSKPPRREDELPIVYEGKPLVCDDDDDDDDDRDIVVHENMVDAAGPKKVNHSSHMRSMSVDASFRGIPF